MNKLIFEVRNLQGYPSKDMLQITFIGVKVKYSKRVHVIFL